MHSYAIFAVLNSLVLIPAIAGAIRVGSIDRFYYPFIFLLWFGLVNEALSIILAYTIKNNCVNSNMYVLLEYLLLLAQFSRWNNSHATKYYWLAAAGFMVWMADNFVLHQVNENNSLFRIFYSFIIVFFSVSQVNKLVADEQGNLLKNAVFLICTAFIAYYTCKAFVEVFNAFHLGVSRQFNRNVFMILYFANLLSNIVYFIAILCMPAKQESTLPY